MKKSLVALAVLTAFTTGAVTAAAPTTYDQTWGTAVDTTATKAMAAAQATQTILSNVNGKNSKQDALIVANSTQIAANTAAVKAAQTAQKDFVKQADYDKGQAAQDKALTDGLAKKVDKAAQQTRDAGQDGKIIAAADAAKAAQGDATKALNGLSNKVDVAVFSSEQSKQDAKIKGNADALAQEVKDRAAAETRLGQEVNAVGAAVIKEQQRAEGAEKGLAADIAKKVSTTTYTFDQSKQDDAIAQNKTDIAKKVDQSVFDADQQRQDKALTDAVNTQKAVDDAQGVALTRHEGLIAKKVDQSAFDADQKRQDKALTDAVDNQKAVDSKQDTAIAGKLDESKWKAGQAIQQSVNKDLQNGINTNKADIAKKVDQSAFDADQKRQDKALATGLAQKVDTGVFQQRAADLDSRITSNKADQAKVNKAMAGRLDNHEQRITDLEGRANGKFADLKNQIDDNKRNADAGVAGVAAMANIPQVLESQTFALGAGVGARNSEQALAVGFSARASQAVTIKASVAADTQSGFTVGAGASVGW